VLIKISRTVSGAIGECFVLGELLKRGHEAYKSNGDVQAGWDIVVVDSERENPDPRILIQVKTIDWPEQSSVNIANAGGYDYLVVVLLDRTNPRSRFFIFEATIVDSLLSPVNDKRTDKKRTLTMSRKAVAEKLAQYEDNWSIIR